MTYRPEGGQTRQPSHLGGAQRRAVNAARDEESTEIVARCRDFLADIERETAEQHFTYGKLEENDEDLT